MDIRNWTPPAGLQPALQHYILTFELLLRDSNLDPNGIPPQLALPDQSQRGLQTASPRIEQVSHRQEHSEGVIPGGVQGPNNPHGEQRISFYRNPPGNRRGNAHLPHHNRGSTVLSLYGTQSSSTAPTHQRHHEEEGRGTHGSVLVQ